METLTTEITIDSFLEEHNFSSKEVAQVNIYQAVFEWVDPPATRNSSGNVGQMSFDNDYFYLCFAQNQWSRTNLYKGW